MKTPIDPARAEVIRHVLAAKQIAKDVNEPIVVHYLEYALFELMGNEEAGEAIERLPVN